jgi:hydrogenase nickel incorporation protein HypA/HybF
MHEFSVAKALVTEIRKIVAEHGGGCVTKVELVVGPLSGVEPLQLTEAFRVLTVDCELSQAELNLIEVSLLVRCNTCQRNFEVGNYEFRCPHCAEHDVHIEQGDGVILRTLTLEEVSPAEVPICPSR